MSAYCKQVNPRRRCAGGASLISFARWFEQLERLLAGAQLAEVHGDVAERAHCAFDIAGVLGDLRCPFAVLDAPPASPAATARLRGTDAGAILRGGALAGVALGLREVLERAGSVVLEDVQAREAHMRVEVQHVIRAGGDCERAFEEPLRAGDVAGIEREVAGF